MFTATHEICTVLPTRSLPGALPISFVAEGGGDGAVHREGGMGKGEPQLCERALPFVAAVRHRHQVGDGQMAFAVGAVGRGRDGRSEEHTSELQSLMRISYAGFCLKKKIMTWL